MMRVAAVGTGYWGPNLARNLQELGALEVVCDLVAERAAELAGRFGVRSESSYEAVLADPGIGAVVLATPVATHHALAVRALEAGKHVFVEKPLAWQATEAEDLCRRADASRKVLMVGHLLEYHPAFVALRDRVFAGDLGQIRHIRCTRFNLGKLRAEENVLWSFAPHDLSLIMRLSGAEPSRVQAVGHRLLGTEREDTVYADLAFEGGLTAHVQVSWLEPVKQHQFVVVGDRKMAVFNDILEEGKLRLYDRGFDAAAGGAGFSLRDRGEEIVELPPVEPMKAELQDFLAACESGGQPLADGWSGLRVVRTLERISAAIAAGHPAGRAGGATAGAAAKESPAIGSSVSHVG